MASIAPPAIKRLQQDLKYLKENPIAFANAEPISDANLMTWYGIIIPPESSLLFGVPLRFCLEFPNDYPNEPPKAYFESHIVYQNGATMYDSKGRMEVCLNIFGNFKSAHSEWGTSSEGWSPSYSISTILVSMQGMMVEQMFSEDIDDVDRMTKSARALRCDITGHDGSDPSKYFPKIMDYEETKKIAELHAPAVQTPLETHYICYANQERNGRNAVLGYGIHVENERLGTISSPCEYLCLDAFKASGIRRSSTNLPIEQWLPVLIDKKNWEGGQMIKKGLIFHVNKICEIIKFNGNQYEKVFKVCSSLMNSLVVEIMKNEENATANDKFINGYFAIYRLLLEYAKDEKALVAYADATIAKYFTKKTPLSKQNVANLGEFIIYITISGKYGWKDICDVFMEECDARNFLWYAVGNRYNSPAYPELANLRVSAQERATKVLDATKVSRQLVMFQVRFVTVARNLWESGMLDSNVDGDNTWNFHKYGLLPEEIRSELKGVYKAITKIKSWNGVFEWLGMKLRNDEERGRELENARRLSASRGYHR